MGDDKNGKTTEAPKPGTEEYKDMLREDRKNDPGGFDEKWGNDRPDAGNPDGTPSH